MGGFGLLGASLSHSYSPMIHAELGDYEYKLYEKRPDELENFLLHGDFKGLNVTIPYKKTVMPFCAALSGIAMAIGSVNTVIRLADGSLYGDNTDHYGFSYLLGKTGVDPAAGKTLVLGSGGSSLTVQAVLRDAKAKEVVVVSRSGADNYGNLEKHRDGMMIVNTTPVGMYPDQGLSPLGDLCIFPRCRAIIDIIYNPPRTELLLQGEERGMLCVDGLAMLVAQAKRATELFMGSVIPDGQIEAITAKVARRTRNVVLIGMPGCGKSSIGAALAKRMGREFVDTDEWVARAAGKPISAIFTEDGEEAFRRMERDGLKALCEGHGQVIATGGGIVTRQENRKIARANGIVLFLDRAISELPMAGRPLSQRDGIDALAAVRLPLYKQWSDHTIPVRGVEQTATDIFAIL